MLPKSICVTLNLIQGLIICWFYYLSGAGRDAETSSAQGSDTFRVQHDI